MSALREHAERVRQHRLSREMGETFGFGANIMREMLEARRRAGDRSAILELYVPSANTTLYPLGMDLEGAKVSALVLRFDARVLTGDDNQTELASKVVALIVKKTGDRIVYSSAISTLIAGGWIESDAVEGIYGNPTALREKLKYAELRAGYFPDYRDRYKGRPQRETVVSVERDFLADHSGSVRMIWPR